MPPASLSTLAVIMPGPITAKAATSRAQRVERARGGRAWVAAGARASASPMQDLFEDVVDGDDAQHPAARVLHGEREEVVLRGLLGDVLDRVVGGERRRVVVHGAQH